jgi:hypothetical protein
LSELEDVATVERKRVHALASDKASERAGACVETSRLRGHNVDRLFHVARREPDV